MFLARGPVSLLLRSAAQFDIAIDPEPCMKQVGEVEFSILTTPFQYLRGITRDRILNHRAHNIARTRSDIADHGHIDFKLLQDALATQKCPEALRISRWYTSLSCLSNSVLHSFDQHHDGSCPCGAPSQTPQHMIWECPLSKELRDSDPVITALKEVELPEALKLGIPYVSNADPKSELWGPQGGPIPNVLEKLIKLFGFKPSYGNTFCEACDCFQLHMQQGCNSNLNTKQLFSKLRGPFGSLSL
jgi:hypothetical protein